MIERSIDGWELLAWVRSLRFGNPPMKLVLQLLAERGDAMGRSYPGQKLLADESDQKVRAVREQLSILEELGVFTREHRYGPDGKRTSDAYVLRYWDIPKKTDFTERVREIRRDRSGKPDAEVLAAPDAGSTDDTLPVDNGSASGAPATDYRRPGASTSGAGAHSLAAPGRQVTTRENYQEELPEKNSVVENGTTTSAGAHEQVAESSQPGSSSSAADDAATPSPASEVDPDELAARRRSEEIRERALGFQRRTYPPPNTPLRIPTRRKAGAR